jgi:hypothetical protein
MSTRNRTSRKIRECNETLYLNNRRHDILEILSTPNQDGSVPIVNFIQNTDSFITNIINKLPTGPSVPGPGIYNEQLNILTISYKNDDAVPTISTAGSYYIDITGGLPSLDGAENNGYYDGSRYGNPSPFIINPDEDIIVDKETSLNFVIDASTLVENASNQVTKIYFYINSNNKKFGYCTSVIIGNKFYNAAFYKDTPDNTTITYNRTGKEDDSTVYNKGPISFISDTVIVHDSRDEKTTYNIVILQTIIIIKVSDKIKVLTEVKTF